MRKKKKVEADQRMRQSIRKTEGTWKDAKYFIFRPKEPNEVASKEEDDEEDEVITEEEELEKGTWEFKNNFMIDKPFIESSYKEAEDIRLKKAAEKELQPKPHYGQNHENNDSCSVQ